MPLTKTVCRVILERICNSNHHREPLDHFNLSRLTISCLPTNDSTPQAKSSPACFLAHFSWLGKTWIVFLTCEMVWNQILESKTKTILVHSHTHLHVQRLFASTPCSRGGNRGSPCTLSSFCTTAQGTEGDGEQVLRWGCFKQHQYCPGTPSPPTLTSSYAQ